MDCRKLGLEEEKIARNQTRSPEDRVGLVDRIWKFSGERGSDPWREGDGRSKWPSAKNGFESRRR